MAVLASETWKVHVINQSSQTCGDLLSSSVTSSLMGCSLLCLLQTFCYMFEFSKLTNVCNVFMGVAPSNTPPTVFNEPRVVYKGLTNCDRSGYTFVREGNLCVNFNGNVSWNDAKKKCENDNGRLLVLTTPTQINGIRNYMRSIGKEFVFIGLTDTVTERHWKWIDGTPLDRSMWSAIDMNNYDGGYLKDVRNADCAMLSKTSLFDVHCNARHPFICERPQLV